MPLISIITPVLNEERMVRTFFDHLAGQDGDFEVIVVDGGSTDDTRVILNACTHGFPAPVTILQASRGRSIQMNAGAAAAQGTILLFLHVDCVIPPDSLAAIEQACAHPGIVGGAFLQSFAGLEGPEAVGRQPVNLLAGRLQTFFGDFGIFVDREVFVRAGGFPLVPYCEDIELCRAVRPLGRLVQIDRVIQSSPRRFERFGGSRLAAVYLLALGLNLLGVRPISLKRFIID
ncbi:TIGR04283 family arsenosugar biosynthesis glycosyltransferase [Methanosphaerula subterraneus]|uniref:TIGR04283 family arsenosugar biosynthesis glycosyltransferase n=1 Tax=Methanosphaerula subterraneus TaxID=3350244 RepID=UPI003F853BB9